jgi:hypothetical protein
MYDMARGATMEDPHQDLADAGPKDQELEERRLATAIVAGEIPPIWYRQRMGALAAEQDAVEHDAVEPDGAGPPS